MSTKPRSTRRRRQHGWVPDQHGAWFMVTIPPLLGVVIGGPVLVHLPVVLTWLVGYFAFFAAGLWLKSRRKQRFLPALVTYSVLTAVAGLVMLVLDPGLLWWAPVFAPLVGVAVWEMLHRRPRSLASGFATVLAAGLMLPVTAHAAGHPLDARLWAMTAVVTGYFLGTIPVVKTLIRNRGQARWVQFSLLFHCVFAAMVILLWWQGLVHPILLGVSGVLLWRAWFLPWWGVARGHKLSPRDIGLVEVAATAVIVLGTLWPVG